MNLRKTILEKLPGSTETIAQLLLPVAVTSTVTVSTTEHGLKSLFNQLSSSELPEADTAIQQISSVLQKIAPEFLDEQESQNIETQNNIKTLAKKHSLQPFKGNGDEAIQLIDYWPKNEFNLLPQIFYPYSTLDLAELTEAIDTWSFVEKEAIFAAHLKQAVSSQALKTATYTFDIICDYRTVRELQHAQPKTLSVQPLSPYYGFETPSAILEAKLDEQFEACFEMSHQLYQHLFENGYKTEAQYAMLMGHKQRCAVTVNAEELFWLLSVLPPEFIQSIYELLTNIHPLIASQIENRFRI